VEAWHQTNQGTHQEAWNSRYTAEALNKNGIFLIYSSICIP
jgi:hypothetical protein